MAAANVLLPSLVKLHFPRRIGLLTSIYTTALAIGLSLSSVLTVPISEAAGTWRVGLAAWAVTALIAALPWLLLVRHDRALDQAPATITLRQVARTRLGWAMAVFFGLQSHAGLRDLRLVRAGLPGRRLLGDHRGSAARGDHGRQHPAVLLPALAGRPGCTNPAPADHRAGAALPGRVPRTVLAPVAGAWLWAVVIGTATATFPVVLTLIGLRARTSAGTAALSGFTQSVGYLIAAVGPFGVGVLHDLTGGWTVPLVTLAVLAVPQVAVGLMVSRRRFLEDATA